MRSTFILMAAASGALCLTTGTVAETAKEKFARFELFADCRPMRLAVEGLPDDADEIGLTRDSIQAATESRLRSARVFDAEGDQLLYVNVNVFGRVFSVELSYFKRVYDPLSGDTYAASTWNTGSIGTHGENAGFILSFVSRHMDEFLVAFLRVNEAACGER